MSVRNGTHKLVVEGLVQNQEQSVVTTRASDITNFASYLPIYHNESYVVFQPKYVSLFITLDNLAYVVPADSSGMCAPESYDTVYAQRIESENYYNT